MAWSPDVPMTPHDEVSLIPKRIDLIWFGKPVDHLIRNVQAWKRMNSDYIVVLWYSDPSVEVFAKKYDLHIENIFHESHGDLPNMGRIRTLVDNRWYWLASDVLRFSIKKQFGGWYFDLDMRPLKQLSEIHIKSSERCLNLVWLGIYYSMTETIFCTHACTLENPVYAMGCNIIKRRLEHLFARDFWLSISDRNRQYSLSRIPVADRDPRNHIPSLGPYKQDSCILEDFASHSDDSLNITTNSRTDPVDEFFTSVVNTLSRIEEKDREKLRTELHESGDLTVATLSLYTFVNAYKPWRLILSSITFKALNFLIKKIETEKYLSELYLLENHHSDSEDLHSTLFDEFLSSTNMAMLSSAIDLLNQLLSYVNRNREEKDLLHQTYIYVQDLEHLDLPGSKLLRAYSLLESSADITVETDETSIMTMDMSAAK